MKQNEGEWVQAGYITDTMYRELHSIPNHGILKIVRADTGESREVKLGGIHSFRSSHDDKGNLCAGIHQDGRITNGATMMHGKRAWMWKGNQIKYTDFDVLWRDA